MTKGQRRYAKLKGEGRCTRCGAVSNRIVCEPCQTRKNAENLAYVHRMRHTALHVYGNGRCACCGEAEERFLTIDHVNGGGTKHREETGAGSGFYAWLKRNNFPSGYQVLCFNCNCGRACNGGVCPHENNRGS